MIFVETPALAAGYGAFDVQGGRTAVAFPPDAISQSLEALVGGFPFGEDYLVQVPDLKGRQEPPTYVHKILLVQRDEPLRRPDAEEFGAGLLACKISLEPFVL